MAWRIIFLVALSAFLLAGCSSGSQLASTASIGASTKGPALRDVAVDERAFLAMINAHRRANGVHALRLDPSLKRTAQDMARRTAKAQKLGIRQHSASSVRKRISKTGYPYFAGAENLVRGRKTEAEAFAAWKASAGHNKNMLHPWLTEMGLARTDARKDGKAYWVLILGLPEEDTHVMPAHMRPPQYR